MTTQTAPSPTPAAPRPAGPFKRWLLEGYIDKPEGAHAKEGTHHQHSWWQVMCLTGVDYFSTLGYQPGIAALAAGALSPLATLILVLLTLFGALPIYSRVARESPHGEGSIAMLEHLLQWWKGKLFVLALLGFVATDFVITMTLSAADATAHIVENPFVHHYPFMETKTAAVLITLGLLGALGAVFLKGFKEAIGIAVALVGAYLLLNAVVIGVGLFEVVTHPQHFPEWRARLTEARYGGGNPVVALGLSLFWFPKLALGLSGFETGVAVMPLVKGAPGDDPQRPEGRIRNTRKLLLVAALIMSVYLLTSSVVTTLLIPPDAFKEGGEASGRALAYLAHEQLGDAFGTVYDLSTIAILWFAGASAMAGLLNIVPRYLPRYGMAPEWTRAARPLVLVFTAIAFAVTLIFRADVEAQGGAYATGVLVLMTSAAVAVTIAVARTSRKRMVFAFGLIALVFAYTTVVNVIERPDGVKIASFFIGTIVVVSLVSRVWRTLELRVAGVQMDDTARRFVEEAVKNGQIALVPNHPDTLDQEEYDRAEADARRDHEIDAAVPLLLLEVYVRDPSAFTDTLKVTGVEVAGHRVLRAEGTAVPNGIAALLMHLRDTYHVRPHAYFNWSEGNPLLFLIRYVLSGQGDIAPVTREVLRQAEPDPRKRPAIHAAM